jgi:hypothetical protein
MGRRTPTVISTARQRFQFVVRFARLDLAPLRPGDWLNLQWELRDFLLPTHADLRPGGLHVWPTDGRMPEEYTREDFQALQWELRDLLALIIASRGDNRVWTYKPVQFRFAVPHVDALPAAAPGRHFVSVQGSTRDMFFMVVQRLLGETNTAALARCPECDLIFLRRSNQRYCTRACTNRVSHRQWRQRQASSTP